MFCALAYSRKSLFTASEKSQETEFRNKVEGDVDDSTVQGS